MENTATPETGPVDAPASLDSVVAEIEAGQPQESTDDIQSVVDELVKETEGDGQAEEAPETEESATDPIEQPEEPEEEAPPEEAEDEDETPPADDPIVKVKVNGEDVEVPLSEALKGYSRTEDYKAKTMALADERRQLEQAKATVEADVKQQYANELKQQIAQFEALDPVLMEARQIDWDRLKREDPATFVQYSEAVNERIALIEQHRAKIEQIEQERQATQAQQAQAEAAQRLELAANKIVETMPELATEENFQRFATSSIETLREIGFTGEEIMEAVDDRALRLAHYARIGMEVEKAKKSLPERKVVPKSAVKPMKSDASDSPRTSRPRLSPNAGRDEKVDFALKQLLQEE
jgi:hypothetical protein